MMSNTIFFSAGNLERKEWLLRLSLSNDGLLVSSFVILECIMCDTAQSAYSIFPDLTKYYDE